MREAEYCQNIFILFSGDTLALRRSGALQCVCFQVCEVQTSQSDVREGQHAIKGAAGKVSLLLVLLVVRGLTTHVTCKHIFQTFHLIQHLMHHLSEFILMSKPS